jgi:transposase
MVPIVKQVVKVRLLPTEVEAAMRADKVRGKREVQKRFYVEPKQRFGLSAQRLRKRLQARKTSSARRLLKQRRRKEARFAADVNHQISKRIVAEAQRTGCGIAVEELTGIRVERWGQVMRPHAAPTLTAG